MSVDSGHWSIYKNAVDVIPHEELERRLAGGETLRVKLGIDPTAPDIHLGFAVVLKELRAFQDLGHTAVLVIGDYTARVGDPSGRSKERPILSTEQIEENTRTYLEQAYLILDPDRTEVRRNSEWLAPLTMADLITSDPGDDRRPHPGARRLRQALRREGAHHADRATLSLDAGLRLGRHRRGRRARRHRPALQPAHGPPGHGVLRHGAPVRRHDPAPRRHRWLHQDEQVRRQLHRRHRPSGRDVRQGHEHPRPPDARLLLAPARQAIARGRARRAKRELARSLVRTFHGESAVADAEKNFDAVVRREVPEDAPVVELPDGRRSGSSTSSPSPASRTPTARPAAS